MKTILSILMILSAYGAVAQNEEKITIPKGIVYNYCDPQLVEKAKQLISTDINDSTKYNLCDNLLIVGPVLWNRFKNIEAVAAIPNGNTSFKLGNQTLTGKMTQDVKDTRTVWQALRKEINGQSFIIRKLTERELQYYWAVISFDIDEPLLIVETSQHRYILNILKKEMKLMWLDEAPK